MLYRLYIKQIMDVALALGLIVLTLPIQIGIAVVLGIWLGPQHILFLQRRIGYKNQPFTVWKFTSLKPVAKGQDTLAVNTARVFWFGTFLRQSVLDELPQLYQILTGKMSLIGPRPLLPSYLSLYSPRQLKRHKVRPGITGLAQVKGGNAISWGERFELDITYVEMYGFGLDCQILRDSLLYLLKAKRQDEPTMLDVWRGQQ